MNVLHLCTTSEGGAAIAALRLHEGLLELGLNSNVLFRDSYTGPLPGVHALSPSQWLTRIKQRIIFSEISPYLRTMPVGSEFMSDRSLIELRRHPLVRKADIVHLHWVSGFVHHPSFFSTALQKKVVWTMHGMDAFTGGCIFSYECQKYEGTCGTCPQLGSKESGDLSASIWKRKQNAYADKPLAFVAPSNWIAEAASKSSLLRGRRIRVIPYGLSTTAIKKMSVRSARELLGIPADKTIVLFGASSATLVRKGADHLTRALEILKNGSGPPDLALAVFGDSSGTAFRNSPFPVYPLQKISDERALVACYSAADLFAIPSLADNLPNTALEAMACALPVVGFDVGGIRELIRHGTTGLLAKPKDADDLARQIRWMIENPVARGQMGAQARLIVEDEYPMSLQASRYRSLYLELTLPGS